MSSEAVGLSGAAEICLSVGGRPLFSDELGVEETLPGVFALLFQVPPETPVGSSAVVLTADGVSTPNGPYLSVSRP